MHTFGIYQEQRWKDRGSVPIQPKKVVPVNLQARNLIFSDADGITPTPRWLCHQGQLTREWSNR